MEKLKWLEQVFVPELGKIGYVFCMIEKNDRYIIEFGNDHKEFKRCQLEPATPNLILFHDIAQSKCSILK